MLNLNGEIGNIEIVIIERDSTDYPEKLRSIPQAPKQLFCAGDIYLPKEKGISVVGSRKHTLYGKNVRFDDRELRLAEKNSVPVISGLALGIDAFSHEGALDAAEESNRSAWRRNRSDGPCRGIRIL